MPRNASLGKVRAPRGQEQRLSLPLFVLRCVLFRIVCKLLLWSQGVVEVLVEHPSAES